MGFDVSNEIPPGHPAVLIDVLDVRSDGTVVRADQDGAVFILTGVPLGMTHEVVETGYLSNSDADDAHLFPEGPGRGLSVSLSPSIPVEDMADGRQVPQSVPQPVTPALEEDPSRSVEEHAHEGPMVETVAPMRLGSRSVPAREAVPLIDQKDDFVLGATFLVHGTKDPHGPPAYNISELRAVKVVFC